MTNECGFCGELLPATYSVGKSKMSQSRIKAMNSEEGVLYKEIWNAAIEAAAEEADKDHGSYCEEIRKLKK